MSFIIHHPRCILDHHSESCMDQSGAVHEGFPQTKAKTAERDRDEKLAMAWQLLRAMVSLMVPLDDMRIQYLLAEDGVRIEWIQLQEILEAARQLVKPPMVLEGEYVDTSGVTPKGLLALPAWEGL